jgi:chromosome partitioning protein
MTQAVSIANQKGGVGKTTTAVNLSCCLAAAEKSCLLVDCDPQGNATTGLGFERSQVEKGLFDLLAGSVSAEQVIMRTSLQGLDLIGATPGLIGAEVEMASMREKEFRLRKGLAAISDRYDYIFMDCPPSLGNLTYNALIASDSIIVPIQCEYYALKALGRFLKMTRAVKEEHNPLLRYRGFLLTMVDMRSNLTKRVIEKVKYTLKGMVFETYIPRNVRLAEVPYYGQPVFLFDPRSKGAQAYMDLAKEILAQDSNSRTREVA